MATKIRKLCFKSLDTKCGQTSFQLELSSLRPSSAHKAKTWDEFM